jgi:hypothetical protein
VSDLVEQPEESMAKLHCLDRTGPDCFSDYAAEGKGIDDEGATIVLWDDSQR